MKHNLPVFFILVFLLSACAGAQAQTSEVFETSEVLPTATSAPSPIPESPTAILADPTRLAEQKLTIPGTDGVTLDATDQATWDSAPEVTDEPTVKVWSEAMNQVLYVDKNGEVKAAHDAESEQIVPGTMNTEGKFVPAGESTLTPEILAALQGQKYTLEDTDGNGQNDKIVAANGETLYKYVLEADRVNPEDEWQRMITFTTTDSEKIEMPRFETFDEALLYISKHAYWRTGGDWMSQLEFWTSFDNPRVMEYKPIFSNIKKIPGWSAYTGFTSPSDSEAFVLLQLHKVGANALLRYEPEENWFEIIYVNESAESFDSLQGTHSVPTPQP